MSILSKRGVKPEMQFTCCDCEDKITGQQVIDDHCRLHIVTANREKPELSTFRCECCQEDYEDNQ